MKHMIYTLIVLACMSAILIIGGERTITGRATAEQQASQQSLGTYSVLPHFTVEAGFSLDTYQALRIQARNYLIEEVSKCSGELETCIRQAIAKLELYNSNTGTGWLYKCGYDKERLFYDLAEFYQDCKDSPDTGCVCTFDFKKPYAGGKYEIGINSIGSSIVIESEGVQSIGINGVAAGRFNYAGGLSTVYDLGDQRISAAYTGQTFDSADITMTQTASLAGKLILFKSANSLATVLSEQYSDVEKIPSCTIKPKRTAYFCVVSDEKVTAYDESDRETKPRNLVYRFALYFPEQSAENELH